MRDPGLNRLRRSYDRNLGHARFWAGVGTALLGAFLLFTAEALWEIGKNPALYTPEVEFAFSIGTWLLAIAVAGCFLLAAIFGVLYQRDDAALAEIEEDNG